MVIRMPVHYSKLTSSDSLVSCILKSRSLTPGVLCVARGSGLLRQNTGCKFNTEIKLCYSTVVNSFTNAQRVATVTFIASPNFLSVPNYFCNTPYIWQLVSKKKYTRVFIRGFTGLRCCPKVAHAKPKKTNFSVPHFLPRDIRA